MLSYGGGSITRTMLIDKGHGIECQQRILDWPDPRDQEEQRYPAPQTQMLPGTEILTESYAWS